MTIRLSVNGTSHELPDSRGTESLIDFLHEDLNLTGTKLCCGIGICKACTVQVVKPPSPVPTAMISCSTALSSLNGTEIHTIESVAQDGIPDPVQQSFLDHFAFQCGYCAPGFVMATRTFLTHLQARPLPPDQLEEAMMDAIGNHICRCTGYVRYFNAIRDLAERVNAGEEIKL
ncbi:(2Fe-2S)-binding protein [Palleronia caenipelagi]|uniref:2Fe-2S iron-sulfur cluster binding domain-containing protein n=1 Tax=Palleronia caenipelagi TaxID=2489174 RepID=A0A547Q2N0_9RHOB|nr:2Fe-2S iron-sulfur cluster-binding protein [Palleronia caenipelagi]TRD20588.1 2Fe-2S iron-sulfur cluster binding domain-containing protein [Palleronia caenipelagi]